MNKPLLTAVGSFPASSTMPEESIRYYADLQLDLDFDVITDGEPRYDMISYFVHDIPGLGFSAGKPVIVGRIRRPDNVNDCLKAKDLGLLEHHLREVDASKAIKIAVTGPVTLGFACAIGASGPYNGPTDPDLYEDLALALSSVASHLQSRGAIVQVDEPGLSGGFVDPKRGVSYLRRAVSELDPERTVVHACGRISPGLHGELLRLENVGTLSHAFAGNPENLTVPDPRRLAEAGKKLGVGCARVGIADPESADPPSRIVSILEKVKGKVGEDMIRYVQPDCGLRSTKPRSAEAILHNLSESMRTLTS